MELKEAQQKVEEYFRKSGFEKWPAFVMIARMQEEIVEIARIISVQEGYRSKDKIDNMDIEDEFGDALFQLALLANQQNVDLSKAMARTFKKYDKYIKK